MKVGLKEIAERAGVSIMTVSGALNESGRISKKRREEIRNIAYEMGYYPNAAAQLLKQKEKKDLGLIIFEDENIIRQNAASQDIIIQFLRECNRLGVNSHIEWLDCQRYPNNVPQLLTNGLVGGLLIAGESKGEARVYIEKHLRLPYVTINEPSQYSVSYEIGSAICQTIYYLFSIGHRNIGMINGPAEEITTYTFAKKAFIDTTKLLSLDSNIFYSEITNYSEQNNDIDNMYKQYISLDVSQRPTVILSGDGLFTKSLISSFTRYGIKIPNELSIVCYETLDWEVKNFYPQISAIDYHYEDIVVPAISMLQNLMDNIQITRPQLLIQPIFKNRQTLKQISNI